MKDLAFDIDVLIVFADADNTPKEENDMGWISHFKKYLEFMLIQILGEKPKILLKGEHDSMTSPKLDNVGVLIPILSKDFTISTLCLEHIQSFHNAIGSTTHKNRIFKVLKSSLTTQEQPALLRDMLGYEMYQLDADSGDIGEFTDYFTTEAERQYWMRIVDLSYDVYNTLRVLKDGQQGAHVKKLFKGKTIYLAETGYDLSVQRSIITRELLRHGYLVLPNQTLPARAEEIERAVRRDLSECSMSIHLIGNAYGDIPEGSDRSTVDLQNKIAAEKSQLAKENNQIFSRLIWISPNLPFISERQKAFIETIKHDVEGQEGAEILQTPLEDFKNIIREELVEADDRKAGKETGGRAIYFMHDKIDHHDVVPYIEMMEKCGFSVLTPSFEGELLQLRQKHIENLRALDVAIIYKGKVNDHWVRMKTLDLLKAPGFGRKKPIIAKAILAAPGSIGNRETFKNQNLRVIEGNTPTSLQSLKSFLEEFNA